LKLPKYGKKYLKIDELLLFNYLTILGLEKDTKE
jgi:hypothetical protein